MNANTSPAVNPEARAEARAAMERLRQAVLANIETAKRMGSASFLRESEDSLRWVDENIRIFEAIPVAE